MGAVTWYRNNRILVADLASETWVKFRNYQGLTDVAASEHIERAAAAGRATRLARGIYLLEEEARPADPLVIASQLYDDIDHYVTSDGALAFHGELDQPLMTIRTVVPTTYRRKRSPIRIHGVQIKAVRRNAEGFRSANWSATMDSLGHRLTVASVEQAISDALVHPRWSDYFSLMPEILERRNERSLKEIALDTLARSKAASQRLGFLLQRLGRQIPAGVRRNPQSKGTQLDPSRPGKLYSPEWAVFYPDE